jgi:hypothetical protein
MEQLVGFKTWYQDVAKHLYTSPWPVFVEYNRVLHVMEIFEMDTKGNVTSASQSPDFIGVFRDGTAPDDYGNGFLKRGK